MVTKCNRRMETHKILWSDAVRRADMLRRVQCLQYIIIVSPHRNIFIKSAENEIIKPENGGNSVKKLFLLLLAAALLCALGLLPFHAQDAAKLLPVRTVIVTRSGDAYTVDVGAGVRAVGRTLAEALERLREEVSGLVFLPTAEQVVLTEPAAEAAEAIASSDAFRPAAGVCVTPDPAPDVEALSAYLEAHPLHTTVLELRAALAAGQTPSLPRLVASDGGFRIE